METKFVRKWILNGFGFWYIKKLFKKRCQNDNDFLSSNFHQFSIKVASKNTWKQRRFFLAIKIRLKKVHQNNIDFSHIDIMSKKVHRNDINFLLIKITPSKVRWSNVDFLPINKSHNSLFKFLLVTDLSWSL